jgi:hypothetical protein
LAEFPALFKKSTIYECGADYVFTYCDPALYFDLLVLWQTGWAYGEKNVWLIETDVCLSFQ